MINVAFCLSLLSVAAAPKQVASRADGDALPGFARLLAKEIDRGLDGTSLARGTGYPVEPGFYVTMRNDALSVLDQRRVALQRGLPKDDRVAKSCRSGCPFAFWALFSELWANVERTDARARVAHPRRVLWALEGQLNAQSFLSAAYAAAESWPKGTPPSMYMLLDAGPGGIRARHFRLMPPGGVDLNGQTGALQLRVRVLGGDRYELSAQDPGFKGAGPKSGLSALANRIVEIKRRYPGKRVVVLEPAPGASAQDLAGAMGVTFESFPELVLDGVSARE